MPFYREEVRERGEKEKGSEGRGKQERGGGGRK